MPLSRMVVLLIFLFPMAVPAESFVAGPDGYRERLGDLGPGDTLVLRPGTYRRGLPLHGLEGAPGEPITVRGPREGEPARILGRRGHNVVSLVDVGHVRIANLEIDGRGLPVDGVKAEGHSRFAHHVTLEGLTIRNLGRHQQIVGISTKCPTWDWVIRGNRIRGAGTGMYLGDADGTAPFVGGLIEGNRVTGSIGYAVQIKHQNGRPELKGMPAAPRDTVIRHNILAKEGNSATGAMARPNLLVGHFPAQGPGARDRYLIHGNLLLNNPTESLFQGEGRVAFYDNLLVNPGGAGLVVQPHKGIPRAIWLFHNTVISRGPGITLRSAPGTEIQQVVGNAVFSPRPLAATAARTAANVLEAPAAAGQLLAGGKAVFRRSVFCPERWALTGALAAERLMARFPAAEQDFAGRSRNGSRRGAFAGSGTGPDCRVGMERGALPLRHVFHH